MIENQREPLTSLWSGQLALVLLIPAVTMLAWANFAPILSIIQGEFSLDNTSASLVTSATLLAHMAMQLPAGHITDSLGAKRSAILAMFVTGIAVVAAGLAPNFTVLLLCRFLLGVGTGIGFISGRALAIALYPLARRTAVQGIYTTAASVGFILALISSERFAALGGWRSVLLLEGILIIVIILVIMRRLPSYTLQPATKVHWSESLRQPALYVMGLGQAATYGLYIALIAWAPTFLIQRYDIGIEWAGPLAALLTATAALACGLGGILSQGRERFTIISCGLVTALGLILLPHLPNVGLALLVLLVLGWFTQSSSGAAYSFPSLISSRGSSGMDMALISVVGNVGAFSFPIIVGSALDSTGVFATGFTVLGLIGLLISLTVTFWLAKQRSVHSEALSRV